MLLSVTLVAALCEILRWQVLTVSVEVGCSNLVGDLLILIFKARFLNFLLGAIYIDTELEFFC